MPPPASNRPGQRALRKGRVSEPGRLYHVTTATHARAPVFADLTLGRAVVRTLIQLEHAGAAHTLAYVIMPDHVHWLFSLARESPLPTVVQWFKSNSARMVNLARGRPGLKLWQTGYYDHALRRDEDVRAVARYIVANPLRAGLVRSLREYPLWDAVWIDPTSPL
ncbi:MAG: transposase [Thiobacillaceae bacterium]|nr:transposase [Thiobacillaceae bacterium]MCX7672423.1 transposase [Thiobacillaceae bacterium]